MLFPRDWLCFTWSAHSLKSCSNLLPCWLFSYSSSCPPPASPLHKQKPLLVSSITSFSPLWHVFWLSLAEGKGKQDLSLRRESPHHLTSFFISAPPREAQSTGFHPRGSKYQLSSWLRHLERSQLSLQAPQWPSSDLSWTHWMENPNHNPWPGPLDGKT